MAVAEGTPVGIQNCKAGEGLNFSTFGVKRKLAVGVSEIPTGIHRFCRCFRLLIFDALNHELMANGEMADWA